MPLLDLRGGHVRGVLVADRLEAAPFTEADERLLVTLGAEVLRAAEAERLMIDMKRARDEKVRFYEALERLNRVDASRSRCSTPLLEFAGAIAAADFAAVTIVDERAGRGAPPRRARPRSRGDAAGSRGSSSRTTRGSPPRSLRHGFVLPARGLDLTKAPDLRPATRR